MASVFPQCITITSDQLNCIFSFQGVKKCLNIKLRKNSTKEGGGAWGEATQDEHVPPKAKYTSPTDSNSRC